MKSVAGIDRFESFLSLTGLLSSAVLAIYVLVSFLMTKPPRPPNVGEIHFSGDSYSAYNSSRIIAIRLLVIAACFLFSFLIVKFTQRIFWRLAIIPFLAAAIFQIFIISKEALEAVQLLEAEFVIRGWLFLSYLGFSLILPAVILIVLQISVFWREKPQELA